MSSNDFAMKRYIRSINRALPCHGKMKRHIVSQIRCSIEDYLQEKPNADLAMVQAHFGTTQEIAAGYVAYEDTSVLMQKISIKKKVLMMVAGVMAAILLIWIGVVTHAGIEAKNTSAGYIEVMILDK